MPNEGNETGMGAGADVIWIARAYVENTAIDAQDHHCDRDSPICVRMVTGGEAPGPSTACVEIDDPFSDPSADPYLAAQAQPGDLGFAGTLGELRLAPPVRARKVIGVGRNYAAHAAELGNEVPTRPLTFFKSPTCLLASGAPIELPGGYARIDMEAELVVVVGRKAKGVAAAQAWQHVAGYSLGNDVSCRDLQKQDKQWTRAKGFDTFGPCGPFIRMTPPGFVPPLEQMSVQGFIGDEMRQHGGCDLMIFDIPTLIEHLSEAMTLEPGDLIYTGTPAGVSALGPGTICGVRVEGFELGRLTNVCVSA